MTDLDDDTKAAQALEPQAANQITGYRDQIDMAQLMAKAQVLPKHLHGNPGNCLAVITISQSWNLNPILVGLKTSVIPKKGGGETLMFEGQLVNAAINKSKHLNGRLKFDLTGTGKDTTCMVRGTIKGEAEERTVLVTMPNTQNSPLWSGTQTDKEQQLTYLGARMWCRRHLPEVLLGVYTPEDDWTERESDTVLERNNAVRSRVAALESQPSMAVPEGDAFIEGEAVAVNRTSGAPLVLEDELDEPIPEFTTTKKPGGINIVDAKTGEARCSNCDGFGFVEDDTGKGPCPDCANG